MFLKLWYSVRDQSITHHRKYLNPKTGFVIFKMIIATVVILFKPLINPITFTKLL